MSDSVGGGVEDPIAGAAQRVAGGVEDAAGQVEHAAGMTRNGVGEVRDVIRAQPITAADRVRAGLSVRPARLAHPVAPFVHQGLAQCRPVCPGRQRPRLGRQPNDAA
jgi:hypothetical protein